MEKPNEMYRIHVESFLRTDILGDEILLPYSDDLNKAVLLINKLCGQRVQKMEEDILDNFLADKYQELRKYEGDIPKIKKIMREINVYNVKYRVKR